ncbi:MAG: plant virulence effector HPE1-like domain-containing protein [Pseudomonadota bacterium]
MTRLIVLASAFSIAATAAVAGDSVINVQSRKVESGSIISFSCAECPALKPRFVAPDVHGVEVTEKSVDGENKIVQTDNMMGGSAVRIVKAGSNPENTSGQTVERVNGGTLVTSGETAPVVVQPGETPVVADSGVTFEGGGEFNVDEVGTETPAEDGVDGGSQTSSVETVNMNDAEHDSAGPSEPEGEGPHNDGPEIIELRSGD